MEKFISGLILGLSVSFMLSRLYDAAYQKAKKDLQAQWFQGPEGYCLVEKHPGACHDLP